MHLLRATLCLLFAASSQSRAQERAPEEWVNELKTAYAKLGGFTASYRAEGPGKTLEVKMGLDEMSGSGRRKTMSSSWTPAGRNECWLPGYGPR
jgi:hypothetical protein